MIPIIDNGAGVPSQTELAQRIQKFREAMAASHTGALVITSRANFEYLSGYRGPSWSYTARPAFAVLGLEDFVVITNPFEEADINVRPRPFRTEFYQGFQQDAVGKVIQVAEQLRAPGKAKIAIDYGQDIFGRGSLALVDGLRALDGVEVVSGEKIVWSARKIKTSFEVALKKKAFAMMNAAFDEAVANACVGVTKYEMMRAIRCNLIQSGAESVDHILVHVYGKNTDLPDGDVRLEEGDYFWTDFFNTYCGYPADRCRIARCGQPSPEEEKCYRDVRRLTVDLCESIRPGMLGKDVYRLFEQFCQERDIGPFYTSLSRIGHDSGMEVTEPSVSIASWSEDVIETGMVIHLEPKLFKDGGIFQFEEAVWVQPGGNEFLSAPSPETIPVIRAQ